MFRRRIALKKNIKKGILLGRKDKNGYMEEMKHAEKMVLTGNIRSDLSSG